MPLRVKQRRIPFTDADRATLIAMHQAGETLDTICQALDRQMGSIATKVRDLIQAGVLKHRLPAATGKRQRTGVSLEASSTEANNAAV